MKRMVFGGGLGNPKAEGRNPMGVGASAGAPYLLYSVGIGMKG